jgi:hypothetical protein
MKTMKVVVQVNFIQTSSPAHGFFKPQTALGAGTIPVPVEDAESGPQGIFLQVMPGALGQLSLGQLP